MKYAIVLNADVTYGRNTKFLSTLAREGALKSQMCAFSPALFFFWERQTHESLTR